MLALGIDPGTATTGYGLVRENRQGGLEAVDYGVISTPAKLSPEKRLLQIYTEINQLLILHKPELCAVEKLFFQRNVTTAMSVSQARGVVLLALAQAGIEVAEYNPMEVKQAVTGYGGAEKRQVQLMVQSLLQLDQIPKPDDAADALAIAICHLNSSMYNSLKQL
ncbi:MAG: crossover junction endodeoxyribonuclease RuvC [Anaerolineaceae bacterium]